VSASYSIGAWRTVAEDCEDRLQRRLGINRDTARSRFASKVGLAPGTLYNLARDRLKKLDQGIRDQLAAYAIQDLENEIAALNAKLETVRQLRGAEDPKLVGQVQAVLASAQALHAAMQAGGSQ
jgi:capsule polysaccharide export protein KpsE/RkpR